MGVAQVPLKLDISTPKGQVTLAQEAQTTVNGGKITRVNGMIDMSQAKVLKPNP